MTDQASARGTCPGRQDGSFSDNASLGPGGQSEGSTVRISSKTGSKYGRTADDPGSTESVYETAEETPSDGETTPTAAKSTDPARIKDEFASRKGSKQGPHKGERFSTDDDAQEFESDVAFRRASKVASPRPHSTLRRRITTVPKLAPSIGGSAAASQDGGDDSIAEEAEPQDQQDAEDTPDDSSDAESFTLKDRQNAINETHPFGIRIWKPALYKKNRSVEKSAEGDIHSSPGANVSPWLAIFNFLWVLCFGWWLAMAAALGALVCFLFAFAPQASQYGQVFYGLAGYLFYPFGKFVKLEQDEAYADEDEGEGRSISEYEQWQQGDLEDGRLFFGPLTSRSIVGRRRSEVSDETESLLGGGPGRKTSYREGRRARLFGRGQWTMGRVIFFLFFYFWVAPLLLLASLTCWFLVFSIPMGKATALLFYHLRRHPLALSFHADTSYSRGRSPSSILLCTYRAVGLKYWKYTIDGTNIFLINLIGVVLFAIFDYWILDVGLGLQSWIVHPGFVFALALFSIIPLAYFIGQAVASISAQSSMGLGAAINAFFSTVVEVFLYCVALNQGKGQLVEGSIIGSIFAGILFLPGLSMCFGAIKRKTQRFNVKSAGVTSTMLLFAVIAAFGPTLFYQIYGSHELSCHACTAPAFDENCRRCYFTQAPAINDPFYLRAVRPFCWFAAVLLFCSYIIGLWFTLRTHAAVIWTAETEEKRLPPTRSNRLLRSPTQPLPHMVPPDISGVRSTEDIGPQSSVRVRKPSGHPTVRGAPGADEHDLQAPGGHDAPNWGRTKSAVILLGATVLYAIIAEILVNTVDVVLESVDIDEKFLGITLFALVPNTTEFLNAISFAMNGNIALSMEIGSAYALQVCLLQIPALVLYSALHVAYLQTPITPPMSPADLLDHTFSLIFPQWDMVTVILCVFLLSYVYGEGKSNYFKGSILVLTYLVIIVGFYLAGFSTDDVEGDAIPRFRSMGSGVFIHGRSIP